jgi:outer membrane protein TolC
VNSFVPTIITIKSKRQAMNKVAEANLGRPGTFTKVVQRAIDQNLDLAASLNRVQQARAAAKEAGARLKPSGSLLAQSNSFRQSLESPVGRYAAAFPGFDRNQSYLDLGIAATWEVDLFGGLRRAAKLPRKNFR